MPNLPKIAVFTLGGTIASSSRPSTDTAATVVLDGAALLSAVPEAADLADLEVFSPLMVPSGDLQMHDVLSLRVAILEAVAAGADGVVVTQGTDTLEETSFALDVMLALDTPVVFTGAMRIASSPGADGPANLLGAIRVAASSGARGLGVLVVLNDEIHSARYVRKSHTSSLATFTSPMCLAVGYISEDRVRVLSVPKGRLNVPVPFDAATVSVGHITITFDDSGRFLESAAELGFQGLVIAGMGGGHVPGRIAPKVIRLAHRIPVVLASRTGAGETMRSTYGYLGSETHLLPNGVISAGNLSPLKAGILLRLLLMAGVRRDELTWCFEQASDPDGVVVTRASARSGLRSRVSRRPA